MPSAGTAILMVREMQIPLVALMLLGACATKLVRVLRAWSLSAGLGPTELFPRRLRRPAAMAVCAIELAIGSALLLTAERTGLLTAHHRALPADLSRVAAGLLFLIAMGGLVELRERRPDVGCGCFGDLSTRPVGLRSIVRAGLLAAAAFASIGIPAFHLPVPRSAAVAGLLAAAAELVLLAVLSPEAAEVLVRLGYSEPCELRSVPLQRVLAGLRRSAAWRRHAALVTAAAPADMWRELCWWYLVYPAREHGLPCEIVFAVQVGPRRPVVRAAVLGTGPAPQDPAGPEVEGTGDAGRDQPSRGTPPSVIRRAGTLSLTL